MTVLLRGSGRPLVLIALATVVLVAAWLHGWWFPWFLSGLEFVGANSETISGLGGLFQTLEILVGFLLLVFGGAGLRQATQTSSGSGQNMIAGGNIENRTTNVYVWPQESQEALSERPGLLPPPPGRVLGRDGELRELKRSVGVGSEEADLRSGGASWRIIAVHGWPGVGKTTIVSALLPWS